MKKHGFKQRELEVLKGHKIPRYMVFTDTETFLDEHQANDIHLFDLGWVFVWDSTTEAVMKNVTTEFFCNHVLYCCYFETLVTKYKSINIYGHNIFFDLQCSGFFEYFRGQGWQLDWLYDKGLIYILRIKKDNYKILIVSTTNYFSCPLKDLGQMIGLEKQAIDFDRTTRVQLKRYCYRDTEIVMKAIWYYINFIKDNDLGTMALTKSSQALKAYRTRFMDKKIYLHSEDQSFDLERKAYMGGRTEAFSIGVIPGGDFLTLDINSMYPFVMQKYRYPSKLVCMIDGGKMEDYTAWLGGYGMIAEVDLDTPEPAFAVRYNKKLIFPTGQFRTFLCSEGLRYAVKNGYVKKFLRASLYLMDDLFSDYVNFFSGLRKKYHDDNNLVMEQLCKYMHNSLYGKFGQHDLITDVTDDHSGEPYLHREIWDSVNGGWWSETHLMNKIIMTHPGGEGSHSFPGVAAHITENARLELWNLIKRIGQENVIYCDTDSVIIRGRDLIKIKDSVNATEMGCLKIQNRWGGLQIDGLKNYRTDTERHIKGIPASAVEITPGLFRYDSFQRQKSCLKEAQSTGVTITSVTRRLTQHYDKGQVDKDGKVTPYHFTFLEQPS